MDRHSNGIPPVFPLMAADQNPDHSHIAEPVRTADCILEGAPA